MSHKPGTYLGGVRSVECLRLRSRVDEEIGCWHYAMGPNVYFVLDGEPMHSTIRRAALTLARGEKLPPKHVAFATRDCKSDDCANPEHSRSSNRANHGQYIAATGRMKNMQKTISIRKHARIRAATKITMEIARDIRAARGVETAKQLAARYGVVLNTIYDIWAGKTWKDHFATASVFSWAAAA